MLRSEGLRRATAIVAASLLAVVLAVLVLWGARPAEAAFPGANGTIAFTSDRDGNNEIYMMNSDGTSQKNLTSPG